MLDTDLSKVCITELVALVTSFSLVICQLFPGGQSHPGWIATLLFFGITDDLDANGFLSRPLPLLVSGSAYSTVSGLFQPTHPIITSKSTNSKLLLSFLARDY